MSEASFAHAMFPDTYRAAGFRLRQHTLGQAILLQRLGSPYAGRPDPGGPEGVHPLGQMALAIWVCRRTVRQAVRGLNRGWTRWSLRFIGWRIMRYGQQLAHEDLSAYLISAWPEIGWWSKPELKSRPLGAELLLRLWVAAASGRSGAEEDLEFPLAVALWDLAARAEEQGVISLVSAKDLRLMEYYTQMEAAGMLPVPGTVRR